MEMAPSWPWRRKGALRHPAALGPIGIFWDIENCPVPQDVNAEEVAQNVCMALKLHHALTGHVIKFSAYADFSHFPRRLREGCQRTGITLVDVVSGKKDAADKAILVDMFLHAIDNQTPSTIMLISGDVDFAAALHKLGQRGYHILLAVPTATGVSASLCSAATFVWDWPSLASGEGCIPSKPAYPPPRTPLQTSPELPPEPPLCSNNCNSPLPRHRSPPPTSPYKTPKSANARPTLQREIVSDNDAQLLHSSGEDRDGGHGGNCGFPNSLSRNCATEPGLDGEQGDKPRSLAAAVRWLAQHGGLHVVAEGSARNRFGVRLPDPCVAIEVRKAENIGVPGMAWQHGDVYSSGEYGGFDSAGAFGTGCEDGALCRDEQGGGEDERAESEFSFASFVQPGDLAGLKKQLMSLVATRGGRLGLVRVPSEYRREFKKPLFLSEYGVPKLTQLIERMGDGLAIVGVGQNKTLILTGSKYRSAFQKYVKPSTGSREGGGKEGEASMLGEQMCVPRVGDLELSLGGGGGRRGIMQVAAKVGMWDGGGREPEGLSRGSDLPMRGSEKEKKGWEDGALQAGNGDADRELQEKSRTVNRPVASLPKPADSGVSSPPPAGNPSQALVLLSGPGPNAPSLADTPARACTDEAESSDRPNLIRDNEPSRVAVAEKTAPHRVAPAPAATIEDTGGGNEERNEEEGKEKDQADEEPSKDHVDEEMQGRPGGTATHLICGSEKGKVVASVEQVKAGANGLKADEASKAHLICGSDQGKVVELVERVKEGASGLKADEASESSRERAANLPVREAGKEGSCADLDVADGGECRQVKAGANGLKADEASRSSRERASDLPVREAGKQGSCTDLDSADGGDCGPEGEAVSGGASCGSVEGSTGDAIRLAGKGKGQGVLRWRGSGPGEDAFLTSSKGLSGVKGGEVFVNLESWQMRGMNRRSVEVEGSSEGSGNGSGGGCTGKKGSDGVIFLDGREPVVVGEREFDVFSTTGERETNVVAGEREPDVSSTTGERGSDVFSISGEREPDVFSTTGERGSDVFSITGGREPDVFSTAGERGSDVFSTTGEREPNVVSFLEGRELGTTGEREPDVSIGGVREMASGGGEERRGESGRKGGGGPVCYPVAVVKDKHSEYWKRMCSERRRHRVFMADEERRGRETIEPKFRNAIRDARGVDFGAVLSSKFEQLNKVLTGGKGGDGGAWVIGSGGKGGSTEDAVCALLRGADGEERGGGARGEGVGEETLGERIVLEQNELAEPDGKMSLVRKIDDSMERQVEMGGVITGSMQDEVCEAQGSEKGRLVGEVVRGSVSAGGKVETGGDSRGKLEALASEWVRTRGDDEAVAFWEELTKLQVTRGSSSKVVGLGGESSGRERERSLASGSKGSGSEVEEARLLGIFCGELRELLVSHACCIPRDSLARAYMMRYSRPLDLGVFGVSSIDELISMTVGAHLVTYDDGEVYVVAM